MKITYLKMNFTIQAEEELFLPSFKGSTFRGVFGNTFRKIVCALKREDCTQCMLKKSCIYAYVFETFLQEGQEIMNIEKYRNIPHPFIIEPPLENGRHYKVGDYLSFSVIIIGNAIKYLPYFIYTFHQCGKNGIGKGRGRFTLKTVSKGEEIIYSDDREEVKIVSNETIEIPEEIDFNCREVSQVELNLITPVRIKHERRFVSRLDFNVLVKALLFRLNFLHYFHVEQREPQWDYKKIIEMAKLIMVKEDKTYWRDWTRYSTRQDTKMKLGGICGKITYNGKIKPFLPYLKAAEVLHIGKGTSFGLGKIMIERIQ